VKTQKHALVLITPHDMHDSISKNTASEFTRSVYWRRCQIH